jgi:hypothetical protein
MSPYETAIRVVPLNHLPPDLRILAWPALRQPGATLPIEVVLPQRYRGLPTPLLARADHVAVRLPDSLESTEDSLLALLMSRTVTPVLRPLLDIVGCMAVWDETLRALSIFTGNAYFASEEAVGALLATAGVENVGSVPDHLEDLQAFELLYRFPVAYKFRGEYGAERQCRLNGWGRLLYRHLIEAGSAGLPTASWRAAVKCHLEAYRESYRLALERATHAVDDTSGHIWDVAQALPIPVLV